MNEKGWLLDYRGVDISWGLCVCELESVVGVEPEAVEA